MDDLLDTYKSQITYKHIFIDDLVINIFKEVNYPGTVNGQKIKIEELALTGQKINIVAKHKLHWNSEDGPQDFELKQDPDGSIPLLLQ
jgi:hypothetical protein